MVGGDTLAYMLTFGSVVVGIFALIFLFYTNSFLLKRRKKEFGVFNILGMEKSHLAKTIAWENFYVMIISIAGGLILGIALDKAMYLLLAQLIEVEIRLGFYLWKGNSYNNFPLSNYLFSDFSERCAAGQDV